jgi:mono/diheme cytochrome c family protein
MLDAHHKTGYASAAATVLFASIIVTCSITVRAQHPIQPGDGPKSGAELYRAACASCHGRDGRGAPVESTGLDLPLPDFTDCRFASREADADWLAVVHQGGPARAFDRRMPAFGDALAEASIQEILGHVRTFCADDDWPRGELNLPRALRTGKAYPEDEVLLTTSAGSGSATASLIYERRVGPRSQMEVAVPFGVHSVNDAERAGLGDVVLAFKHALAHSAPHGWIVSAGVEAKLPTGDHDAGLGTGTFVFEPFVAFGQVLARETFLQVHAGVELPADPGRAAREAFWRTAFGKTWSSGGGARTWTPMLELTAMRELEDEAQTEWDVVPQVQVSLSKRQHVLLNVGILVPLTERSGRGTQLLAYILWDWFDGGLFDGW